MNDNGAVALAQALNGSYPSLQAIVKPERLTSIVDVGASILDEKPPYQRMLEEGLCTVVGFEPQPDALDELNRESEGMAGRHQTYLPDAIGNGQQHILHVTKHRGMVSFLEPDPTRVGLFYGFPEWAAVSQLKPLDTVRLDDVEAVAHIDFLKVDTQGYEIEVLRSGRYKLARAVAIQAEVSFLPLYRNQPSIGEIDLELRAMGFIPHCFASARVMPLRVGLAPPNNDPHQIVDADILYIRDFARPMDTEQWKQLAMVAHHVAGSHDLAMLALANLARSGACVPDAPAQYRHLLEQEAK